MRNNLYLSKTHLTNLALTKSRISNIIVLIAGYLTSCWIIIFLSFPTHNLFAQTINEKDSFRFAIELDTAYKDIFRQPSRCKSYLDSIYDNLKYNTSLRLKWHNTYGVFYGARGELDSARYHFQTIIDGSDLDTIRKAGAYNNMGIILRTNKLYIDAKEAFRQSMELYKAADDSLGIATVSGSIASLYKDQEMFDLSVDWLNSAIAIFEKLGKEHEEKLVADKQKLANIHLMLEQFASACSLYEEVIPVFKNNENNLYYAITLLNYANALYELNDLDKSEQYLSEAISMLKDFQQFDYVSLGFMHKGKISIYRKEYDKALFYLDSAYQYSINSKSMFLDEIYLHRIDAFLFKGSYQAASELIEQAENVFSNSSLKNKVTLAKRKAQTYSNLGDYVSSAKNWEAAFFLKDSLNQLNKERISAELKEKYQFDLLDKNKKMLETQRDLLQQDIFIQRLYIFLIIAVALLLVFIIYQMRLRSKIKDLALSNLQREKLVTQQQNQVMEMQLHSNQLIIDHQKQQLLATALEAARRNDIITEILQEAQIAQENKTIQLLHKLQMDENYWDQLIRRFAELHPNFLTQLGTTYPELTNSDLEFCALVKMNLSYKDIASLLHISHRSVFTKKYRITQKMKVAEEEDFVKIIRAVG